MRHPQASSVAFVLVCQSKEHYQYYKRHVDVIARKRKMFYSYAVTWCNPTSIDSAVRFLVRNHDINRLLE